MIDQGGHGRTEDWRDRLEVLEQLDAWLRTPMLVLSFVQPTRLERKPDH